ncbi:TRAP transporter large permease [Desulfovibrio sp. OttesenSCG-928-I05]|nr:TRAP transporter large permease [Desulfovibrio sp. OttesenSCG-928-I05]
MELGIVIFLFLVVFFLSGLPIFFALGMTVAASLIVWGQVPVTVLFQQTMQGIDIFSLLAIPMFILMGEIMTKTQVVDDILFICNVLVGRIRGALGHVNIVASMFFAGISGSALADTATLGAVLIPAMKKSGYDAEFSVAVTAASSVIGPIIPPSIGFVLYGALISGVSISGLFAGGILPGILLGVSLMIVTAVLSHKRKYPVAVFTFTRREFYRTLLHAAPALFLPVIVLGGILGGVFTPTESAAVAVVYTILLGFFYYRNFTVRDLVTCVHRSMLTSAAVLVIIAMVQPFGWLVALGQVPQTLSGFVLSLSQDRMLIMAVLTVILLMLGAVMDANIIVLVFAPIFVPIAMNLGVDPIHFGVFYVLAAIVGLATPPYGMCIFVAAAIGDVPVSRAMKAILPFVLAEIVVVFMVAFIPGITLFIPRLLGMVQ